jgi:hypothetical protein
MSCRGGNTVFTEETTQFKRIEPQARRASNVVDGRSQCGRPLPWYSSTRVHMYHGASATKTHIKACSPQRQGAIGSIACTEGNQNRRAITRRSARQRHTRRPRGSAVASVLEYCNIATLQYCNKRWQRPRARFLGTQPATRFLGPNSGVPIRRFYV